ncbi:single-stranded DNA-binding protein [Rhodoferax sp.]|uniref:single-stranded DNA-binding protein n=1 Tax=Rhodoferax sp. TaxID=50421 RepID=UPI00272EEBBB|nr:single-stranded DNA-binding protein [Rhodoferax sp.]MDP1531320.1 single-stranded DNA-binding protein [Rhodoferax sp.]MDP1944783.1 single-stranded DNA-binding protein [Rhodoferax sp.]MDP2443645.1 single-stranded DNA-binding protein [Rhodoferax sp.]MDZ4208383.1 single-stranded DNA-binding protein [Rhodoferax sp.]
MIDGLIAGRLIGDPEQRQGKGDSSYVVARVRAQSSEGEPLMVNLIAFDEVPCSVLLALRDGDSLAAAGHLNPKVWTDKQGNTKPALDLVAHRVVSTGAGF